MIHTTHILVAARRMSRQFRETVVLALSCLALVGFSPRGVAQEWQSSGLGVELAEPGFRTEGDALVISGGGKGLNTARPAVAGTAAPAAGPIDQCRFIHVGRADGDFEISARVAGIGAGDGGSVGLMVRTGLAPDAPMMALVYKPAENWVGWAKRVPAEAEGAAPRVSTYGIPLANEGPLWLRFVRVGGHFAVYKSRDALVGGADKHRLWVMISNVSGGPFELEGPFQLGVFASGDETTATVDSIRIGPAQMRYRTSWVGNSFGARGADQHVSNTLSAMWVAPDGTCYTSSYWDEGGRPVTSYKDGQVARKLPIGTPKTAEGGITGDARYVYVAAVDKIVRCDPAQPGFAPTPLVLATSLDDKESKHCVVSGMASNGRELFVADWRENRIRVVDLMSDPPAERVERAFAFERPGPMAVDQRGELWIIQRGRDFPMGGVPVAEYPAAIRCYTADGAFTGREITDVANPRAVAYDAANDRLLVAENGPDMNVRIYGELTATPTLARTFGEKGGIFAGERPGLVVDEAAGGHARFAGLTGLGVDAKGNLYVGGGFQGSDLRMFTPAGRLGWQLNSLMFCSTYDVDPRSDGTTLYGTYNRLDLDLSQTAPGREQRYVSYNWDLTRFGSPDRAAQSQAILRRLGPDGQLIMYTSGQGQIGDIKLFRYDGEIATPCGEIRNHGKALWIDANGNGKDEPEEVTAMAKPMGTASSLSIDSKGDIWAGIATTGGSFMRHFFFKGLNSHGVPVYGVTAGDDYEDIRFPEEGDTTNAWGMACRLDYDAERDILVAFYPALPRGDKENASKSEYYMARYDGWSQGNRTPKWKVKSFSPWTDPDYFMYETKLFPHSGYMGMQVAGDYVFFAYLHGEVHVFDLNTGKLAEILSLGPEVEGRSAWEDAAMGLRAFKRQNGEYLIFTENSGWGGKNNFFRWTP